MDAWGLAGLPARPVLTDAVRRLWRDQRSLQFGRSSGSAVVLSGVDPTTRTILDLLDGTRTAEGVLAASEALGCRRERTLELVTLLQEAGLLEDAAQQRVALESLTAVERDRLTPDLATLAVHDAGTSWAVLARRRAACVVVLGAGRVGAPLASLLGGAGLGDVRLVDAALTREVDVVTGGLQPHDVGRPRGRAFAPDKPLLAVLAPAAGVSLDDLLQELPPHTPHLLAQVHDATGIVGPLVLPGRTACLHCLDLARTDLDPRWPALASQLAQAPRGPIACAGPLALAVAAQACLQVLAFVDGPSRPATVGGTLELSLPDWRWRRRSWLAHPDCACTSPRGASTSRR